MRYHHIPAPKGIYEEIANGSREHLIVMNLNEYAEGDAIIFKEVYRSELLLNDAATGRECKRMVASATHLPYISDLHGV